MKYWLSIILFAISLLTYSQQLNLPVSYSFREKYLEVVQKNKLPVFTAQSPLLSDINLYIDSDSLIFGIPSVKSEHSLFYRKLREEHLFQYKTRLKNEAISIQVDPLFNFSAGKSSIVDDKIYTNTRGIIAQGNLGEKVSFCTGFYENQSVFPNYYTLYSRQHRVIPGQGRLRAYKITGFDYNRAFGYLSISPIKGLNLQIGNDKQFIGSGYRSLILSDFSFNTPYFKSSYRYKNLRLSSTILALQNTIIADGTTEIDNRRYAGLNSLEVLIGKYVELGLYEWTIFPKRNYNSPHPNLNLLNPIPLFRSFQYGYNNNEINMILAFNTLIKWNAHFNSYGQFVYDKKERYGFQIGSRWMNQYANILLEYNQVQPYTYSHHTQQSFTHYNLPLAHPMGANFSEWVQRSQVKYKSWILSYQFNYIKTSQSDPKNNILTGNLTEKPSDPDAKADFLKDHVANISIHRLRLAYLVNPITHFQIFVEWQSRKYNYDKTSNKEDFILGGMRTNLQNLYFDF